MDAFEIFSQGGDFESCGGLSWGDPLEKLDDLSEGEPVSCELVRVVADVTDVLVSPSSVVTEFVMFPPCALIWNLLNRSPFLPPRSVHTVVQTRRKR